jgi:hypothetical protein
MAVVSMVTQTGEACAPCAIERRTKRTGVSVHDPKFCYVRSLLIFFSSLLASTSQQHNTTTTKHTPDAQSRIKTLVKGGKSQSKPQQHDEKDEKKPTRKSTIFDSLKKSSHMKSNDGRRFSCLKD